MPDIVAPDYQRIDSPDPAKIQITWIGNATFLIQVEGKRTPFLAEDYRLSAPVVHEDHTYGSPGCLIRPQGSAGRGFLSGDEIW